MMRLEVWTVRGRVFHFGRETGLGMENSALTWPSDSLFAALIARLAATEGSEVVQQAVAPFLNGAPPFLLSSTFPCICPENDEPVLLFPVPLAARRMPNKVLPQETPRSKDIKTVRFVSEHAYRRLLSGEPLANIFANTQKTMHGMVLFDVEDWARIPKHWRREDDDLQLWRVEKRPRVSVGRLSNRSNLFYVAGVHFREDAGVHTGLWFGIYWRNKEAFWKERLPALLDDLGAAGLGAERSVGYGSAKISLKGSIELSAHSHTGMWTTLSRYLPRSEEIDALLHKEAAYEIVTVSGWVDGVGQRRRPLNLVNEGAVLATLEQNRPYGTMVDVRPSYRRDPDPLGHAVYRYGYALPVGYGGAA